MNYKISRLSVRPTLYRTSVENIQARFFGAYLVDDLLPGAGVCHADVGGLDEHGDDFGDALSQRVEHHDRRLAALCTRNDPYLFENLHVNCGPKDLN